MATRDYFVVFGSGNPTSKSGLAPTFITFISPAGSAGTPPSISEPGSKGLYKFSYDASLTMIAFTLDGATTGLANSDRYVSGILEAQDQFGITLAAIGTSLTAFGNTAIAIGNSGIALGVSHIAQGNTLIALGQSSALFSFIGSTASSFGSTSLDPVDLFGFLKRAQEINEGNETFTKSSGLLDFYSRGSSTLLREKTIIDSTTTTTKT